MKKTCLSLMLLFCALVFAQNTKNDLAKDNIKGKVLSITETGR